MAVLTEGIKFFFFESAIIVSRQQERNCKLQHYQTNTFVISLKIQARVSEKLDFDSEVKEEIVP